MADGVFARRDPRQVSLAVLVLLLRVWQWYRPGGDHRLVDAAAFTREACLRIVLA